MKKISVRYYLYILRILTDMGLSLQELEDVLPPGIRENEGISTRISVDNLRALMNRAEGKLNDGHIGLHVSQQFRISGYGHAGEIYSACETTEQALAMSIKYACLAHTIGRFHIDRVSVLDASLVTYIWESSFDRNLVESHRHITECIINNYIETVKWLTWGLGDCIERVTFRHSPEQPVEEYSKILGCDAIFNAPETSITFRKKILELPLSTANPVKLALLEKGLNQLLAKYNSESDLVERTKFTLHKIIKSRRPTVNSVAKELSLSERTFKRYLKEQGSQYQSLLQDVKIELFAGYVKEGLSYAEIAQLLWYHDQSALTRAYKKWHGVAPTQHVK